MNYVPIVVDTDLEVHSVLKKGVPILLAIQCICVMESVRCSAQNGEFCQVLSSASL